MKKKAWLRWTAIVILFIVSLVLIFNQQIKYYLVGTYHPQITQQTVQKNNQKKAKYDFSNVQDLNLQSVARARARRQSINVIGVISIPAIKMSVPIGKGVDNNTLALAAGTMRADQQMGQGNYALAGHNMAHGSRILFSPLYYDAKVGQKIYLTDMTKIYEYRITQRQFIDATRVDVVNDTPEKIVTLITCNKTGSRRLMIRGAYVKTMKFKQAPVKVQKSLSRGYTNR